MKGKLEKFIADNSTQMDKHLPDPAVLDRILQQMQAGQQTGRQKGIVISFRTLRWAAAALVLIACGITLYLMQPGSRQQTAAVTATAKKTIMLVSTGTGLTPTGQAQPPAEYPTKNRDAIDRDIAQHKSQLLARLTANNTETRKIVMLAALRDMDSPAKRLTALAQATNLKMAGSDISQALINTLNTDPNTNVRLAALDGLARFYHEGYIRKELIASLKTQQNPAIQIALIELLTRMKEAAILGELDKIVSNDSTITAVKDCAYSGIFTLRKS
jgi:hypothetical protein